MAKYDKIGTSYSTQRKTDTRIATQFYHHLQSVEKILNIGAGTGSYEPSGLDLIAIEPSSVMIKQRDKNAYPAIEGFAESLPFDNKSFSHAMSVLSMHHWIDRAKAFEEIKRVTKNRFVAISWNPESAPFWLTRDYFPEIYKKDKYIFPSFFELNKYFDSVHFYPLLIPEDCQDGFLAAYWKRPEAYLDEKVRNSISTFSHLQNVDIGLMKLEKDISTGEWLRKNTELLEKGVYDAGYVVIVCEMGRKQ